MLDGMKYEEIETPIVSSEETIDASLTKVKETLGDAYHPVDDMNEPDFNVEELRERIKTCIYMELPLWERKISKMKSNFTQNFEVVKSLPTVRQVAEMVTDKKSALSSEEKLQLYNEIQKHGEELEMELKSIIDKYDTNMKFLDELLALIEERMAAEKEEVENSPTSKKTEMIIQMIKNNAESIMKIYGDKTDLRSMNTLNNLREYHDTALDVYSNRTNLDWLYLPVDKGTNVKAIYRLYRTLLNTKGEDGVIDRIENVFKFRSLPSIVGATKDKTLFFYYYLCYISFTRETKKVNIQRRKVKEQSICVFQNLTDCESGLFDIGEDGETNEEKATIYQRRILDIVNWLYNLANPS